VARDSAFGGFELHLVELREHGPAERLSVKRRRASCDAADLDLISILIAVNFAGSDYYETAKSTRSADAIGKING